MFTSRIRHARGKRNGLLLFVVLVGVPIIAVPALRDRLSSRFDSIVGALGPYPMEAAFAYAKAGENRYPVPKEFLRPAPAPVPYPPVFNIGGGVHTSGELSPVNEGEYVPWIEEDPAEPEFLQGERERKAFEHLVESDPRIAQMTEDQAGSLRLRDWSALQRRQDVFLVRLVFDDTTRGAEVTYIWKVDLASGSVVAENYNARKLRANP